MKRAVIISNGSVNTKYLYSHISREDFIIAADGGANKLVKTKFVPSLIIGDMDSVSKNALKKYRNVAREKFPRDKPFIDLELAINYCIEHGFREIVILGALGTRADMTLTNIFALSQLPEKISAKIIHDNQEIFLMQKKRLSLGGIPREKISFLPVGGDVKGLTLKGFRYNLEDFDLRFGAGLGVSNEFKNKKVSISFKDGLLLCVHFRKRF